MLSEKETDEIEALCAHYPHRRAACVDALKVAQRHRGWISDETIHDLAPVLGMTPHELDNVASFYNLIFRRPVGKHVVLLCDSVTCWIMGCERLEKRFEAEVGIRPGETSHDGKFTLLPIACLGNCERAPALMVGERLYTRVDEDKLVEILEEYGHDGRPER